MQMHEHKLVAMASLLAQLFSYKEQRGELSMTTRGGCKAKKCLSDNRRLR